MDFLYSVVGIRRYHDKNGNFRRRKRVDIVTEDRAVAEQIRDYLNSTQDRWEYHVMDIELYHSLDDFIFYNE